MLPPGTRIFVCTTPQDMRKSFDTLAAVVRDVLGQQPEDGALYVFLGKSPTRLKVLWFDRNGYCLLAKRLHRAVFRGPEPQGSSPSVRIDAEALAALLSGVAREKMRQNRLQ